MYIDLSNNVIILKLDIPVNVISTMIKRTGVKRNRDQYRDPETFGPNRQRAQRRRTIIVKALWLRERDITFRCAERKDRAREDTIA